MRIMLKVPKPGQRGGSQISLGKKGRMRDRAKRNNNTERVTAGAFSLTKSHQKTGTLKREISKK